MDKTQIEMSRNLRSNLWGFALHHSIDNFMVPCRFFQGWQLQGVNRGLHWFGFFNPHKTQSFMKCLFNSDSFGDFSPILELRFGILLPWRARKNSVPRNFRWCPVLRMYRYRFTRKRSKQNHNGTTFLFEMKPMQASPPNNTNVVKNRHQRT